MLLKTLANIAVSLASTAFFAGPRRKRSAITATARLAAIMLAVAALAACGGSSWEASQSGGASTIDWAKVDAYGEDCEPPGSFVAQLEDDSTNAEFSEALGEEIDAWESQDAPDALDAYHRAIADFLKEYKKVVDSRPRDDNAQETLDSLEGTEVEEDLEDAYEAAEEAWAKTTTFVRYRLDESHCFQGLDAQVGLPYLDDVDAGDRADWCGRYSLCFGVWKMERDAGKLTLEGYVRNRNPDTLLPLPDCGENLVVRDGDGTFYGVSNCAFSGNIRDGKVPYEESSAGELAFVRMTLEYELPETARELELLGAFESDDDEDYPEGFIMPLSDIAS